MPHLPTYNKTEKIVFLKNLEPREVPRSDALRLAARHEAALLEVSAAEDAESVDR